MLGRAAYDDDARRSYAAKLLDIRWLLLLLLCALAGVGVAMLYSAANGDLSPWASRHGVRFAVSFLALIALVLVDLRLVLKFAYLAYFASLALLGVVEIAGDVGMGAKRWIDLGLFQLQPSEFAKIALVLALARYFHGIAYEEVGRLRHLVAALLLTAAPVPLVLRQPDLGTAALLLLVSASVMLVAGVRLRYFLIALALALAALPIGWRFLHGYQRQRILTFLDPERDPLGAGYHITQSKIALGSGGTMGRGFLQGTQSHLSFLPERQTDFIFTMLAEEFGFVGSAGLIVLYVLIIAYCTAVAVRARSHFGRLLALGLCASFFFYIFINIAMVTGLVPVVGVPLPLVSYGGTAMLTMMLGFGLIMNVYVHRDRRLVPGRGD